jgi:hypothetical protein
MNTTLIESIKQDAIENGLKEALHEKLLYVRSYADIAAKFDFSRFRENLINMRGTLVEAEQIFEELCRMGKLE